MRQLRKEDFGDLNKYEGLSSWECLLLVSQKALDIARGIDVEVNEEEERNQIRNLESRNPDHPQRSVPKPDKGKRIVSFDHSIIPQNRGDAAKKRSTSLTIREGEGEGGGSTTTSRSYPRHRAHNCEPERYNARTSTQGRTIRAHDNEAEPSNAPTRAPPYRGNDHKAGPSNTSSTLGKKVKYANDNKAGPSNTRPSNTSSTLGEKVKYANDNEAGPSNTSSTVGKKVKYANDNETGPSNAQGEAGGAQPPERVKQRIEELGGWDWKLVIVKEMTTSDGEDSNQTRFSMPPSQLKIPRHELERVGNNVSVMVLPPNDHMAAEYLNFKKWGSTSCYVFNKRWKEFVRNSGNLHVRDVVQVWIFSLPQGYGFAFVKLEK